MTECFITDSPKCLQSYTGSSHGASPYSGLSPMDEVTALPSPTSGVSTVAQVTSSTELEGGVMQAAPL